MPSIDKPLLKAIIKDLRISTNVDSDTDYIATIIDVEAIVSAYLENIEGNKENDLKEIIKLIPKMRNGREFALIYDKSGYWYAGYPNRDGDFSIDIYADDKDIEGACLNLFIQTDADDKKVKP